jgi:O-antigen/teichoic acid export membrane protein
MGISMSFLPILGRVFFPLLSNAAEDSVDLQKRYLNWMGIGTVGLAVPVAVGGFLLASPLTDLVLGSSYKGAETLVRWLMFNLIAGPMASLFSAQLIPHSREGRYIASVGSGAALNVVLNLIFIPEYGARAAVWTTILSQFLVAGMGFYFSRDLARPNLKRPLAASVLASSVMSCVVLALLHWFNPHVLILVAVGGSVYGAIFYFCISRFRLAPEMSAKN